MEEFLYVECSQVLQQAVQGSYGVSIPGGMHEMAAALTNMVQ